MGTCVALTECMYLKSRKSNLNFRDMMLNNARMSMHDIMNEKINRLKDLEEWENENIELAFDDAVEAAKENFDEDSTEYQNALTEAEQLLNEEQEKIKDKYEDEIERLEKELDRKERAMELEIEQNQTQLEACEANLNSYEDLKTNCIKSEFSYFGG